VDHRERFGDQLAAAVALADLDRPDLRDEAVAWLTGVVQCPDDTSELFGAAEALQDIAGGLEPGCAAMIAGIADGEANDIVTRSMAASVLARSDPNWQQRAAELFMTQLETQYMGTSSRRMMAPILAAEARPYAAQVVSLLHERAHCEWHDLVGRLAGEILDYLDPDRVSRLD
jgi:hypothetical protein